MARFEKEFRELCRSIDSISAGQARINIENVFDNHSAIETLEHDGQSFYLEIRPHEGPYAYGSFLFHIKAPTENIYPSIPPSVSCLTRVYHPNIDTSDGHFFDNICVSSLNEWNDNHESNLSELFQSLLFLFYSPNLEDPLTSNVTSDENEFVVNVRRSIRGGLIEEFSSEPFPINYGYRKYLLQLWRRQDDQTQFEDSFFDLSLDTIDEDETINPEEFEAFVDLFENSILHQINLRQN